MCGSVPEAGSRKGALSLGLAGFLLLRLRPCLGLRASCALLDRALAASGSQEKVKGQQTKLSKLRLCPVKK